MAAAPAGMGSGVDIRVGPLVITIHDDDQILVTAPEATVAATEQQGFFCADTRLVSTYVLHLSGVAPKLLNSTAIEPFSARYEYVNNALSTLSRPLDAETVHLRLDRTVGDGVHEDYDLTNYNPFPVDLDLEVRIESDFADLFDVREGRVVRRGAAQATWDAAASELTTCYANPPFERGLRLRVARNDSRPQFANGMLSFRVRLDPAASWHTCLLWEPLITDSEPGPPARGCHALRGDDSHRDVLRRRWAEQVTTITATDPMVTGVVHRAVQDLAALRLHRASYAAASSAEDAEGWVPAGGIPWYVTLFGRDALVTSLQTLALSPRFALAALEALAPLTGDRYEPERDVEPGKVEHEIRYGELAALGLIPQTPYYGTHDATTLYVWAAAELWRWSGRRDVLTKLRPFVQRALDWIDTDGDRDGDGLQEYATRAGDWGYYNQAWKDAGDAIVLPNGDRAGLPIATVELQGYVVAAKRGWAQVLEQAFDDAVGARRLRAQADRLAGLIEERFWWPAEGTYYLGLDGDKNPIASVASNPGHLLWAGAVTPDRARRVAARLLAEDMWTGWGVRTLSADHRAYNPFSYQRGSVWPHDNALFVAGCLRYGLIDPAWQVTRALFEAADHFHYGRLPELFAGLPRDTGGFPVQYAEANVPQAWAAGAVIYLVTALAGLSPDAARGVLRVAPAVPDWMGTLQLSGLRVGDARVDLRLSGGDVAVDSGHAALDVVSETPRKRSVG